MAYTKHAAYWQPTNCFLFAWNEVNSRHTVVPSKHNKFNCANSDVIPVSMVSCTNEIFLSHIGYMGHFLVHYPNIFVFDKAIFTSRVHLIYDAILWFIVFVYDDHSAALYLMLLLFFWMALHHKLINFLIILSHSLPLIVFVGDDNSAASAAVALDSISSQTDNLLNCSPHSLPSLVIEV